MTSSSQIIYTKTDEAPALATYSLLPIIRSFAEQANIKIETRDISLSGRIISSFPDFLTSEQKINDDLVELGKLVKKPNANIIKLPNISASIPQLKSAINELQKQGYEIPDYPEKPQDEHEKNIQKKYSKILGSAVNPVLREGNSDRRVADAVKQFAKNNPHTMGEWKSDSLTNVAHMCGGDFYSSEKSLSIEKITNLRIELRKANGTNVILKENITAKKNDVIDAARIDIQELKTFFRDEIQSAKDEGTLLSLHLKATMMKVSDPIIFGHAVKEYYAEAFKENKKIFKKIGVKENNGIGDVYLKIGSLPKDQRSKIENDIAKIYKKQPPLAMVDSEKGITNLHIPSNIIIDASMPAAIRSSGQMWGPDGKLHDTKALIPDRCYARIYQEVINFCKKFGAFDVTKMGNVANIGLMAKKAQEYGSHDKTFEIPSSGIIQVIDQDGKILIEHDVKKGDIWRMCQTQEAPINNWIELAVGRFKTTNSTTIFWLDENRSHDKILIDYVQKYLHKNKLNNSNISILPPHKAMQKTLNLINSGENVISVTGNVLRDYLTDLFPILELGTSAKMLSIVPLLAGGGLYETGAGGSAPKHVSQFIKEGHLRWDSLGEFLAIMVSIEDLAKKTNNQRAQILSKALDKANTMILRNNKSPSRKVGELDNRHSHFYLAVYWSQALSEQSTDEELRSIFSRLNRELCENEEIIVNELNINQGKMIDIGGYYHPNQELVEAAMRPSKTLNKIIQSLKS
ncbi:MAG: NADP-dependent isocitrate dehydrogenase [Pseudomonadota bacterium]|nr:NADP-dependent isocitrate dehydrogenase [Pseudomonadota bacterium]